MKQLFNVRIERYYPMFYTIAVILLILWLLGFLTSFTIGGFIPILLVIAIIMIVFRYKGAHRAF
jgi:hypothetical protein